MNEEKEISLKGFQEKLNIYYSKDNGESITDEIVEKFSRMAISHNKDNNPFFLAQLLQSVKTRNIPLSELVVLDGTVVKEIFHEARQKAIVQQELLQENNSQNNINNFMEDNLEEPKKLTEENIVKAFSEYDSILKKYDNDWKKLISQGSLEEVKRVAQISTDLGLLQKGDDILVQWQSNNFGEMFLTSEQCQDEKIIKRLEEFGVVVKEDRSLSADIDKINRICDYTEGAHTVRCLVEDFLKHNPNVTAQEIQDSLSKIDNNIVVREYLKHTSYEKFSDFCSKMQTKIIAQNKIRKNQSTTYIETSNSEIEMLDMQGGTEVITSDVLEGYFDIEFASMIDPAQANMEQVIEEIETDELMSDYAPEQFETNIPVLEELTQSELTAEESVIEEVTEQSYKSPTFEVEKKGLAKWFDELKKSSNPFAKLITGSMWKKQDNLLNVAEPQKYEDKPSTGRFDATDTQLMPVGKGTRNSIIQAMDKISSLFKGSKKEKQPARVIKPVTTFNDRYKYEVNPDSLGNNSVIIPTTVNPKVNIVGKEAETPDIDDDFSK